MPSRPSAARRRFHRDRVIAKRSSSPARSLTPRSCLAASTTSSTTPVQPSPMSPLSPGEEPATRRTPAGRRGLAPSRTTGPRRPGRHRPHPLTWPHGSRPCAERLPHMSASPIQTCCVARRWRPTASGRLDRSRSSQRATTVVAMESHQLEAGRWYAYREERGPRHAMLKVRLLDKVGR